MPWLINPAQLDKFRKNQKSLIILDASYHAPNTGRDAHQEFLAAHIPDAHFLDLELFNDRGPNAPHNKMLTLDTELLSKHIGALGIRPDYKIIFYDQSALHTACRALWMFKVIGHAPQQLYILDGGFTAWKNANGKTSSGPENTAAKPYPVQLQLRYLRTLENMKDNLQHPREQVLDARHAVRFAGGPEDRPNLRSGHIPNSYSFPFTSIFDVDGCFRPLEKIRQCLSGIGLDLNAPIITSCGSGTTAPILNFALDLLDKPESAVYNGSWSEWGYDKTYLDEESIHERPVATCIDS